MAKKAARTAGMSIDRSRYAYSTTKALDASGKVVSFTGKIENPVAVALFHSRLDGTDIGKIAKANKLEIKGANPGQQRMNLGNSLTAMVRKGTPVTIGKHTVKSLTQRIALPEGVKAAEKRAAGRAAAAQKPAKAKPAAAKRGSKPASRTKSSASRMGGNATTTATV